MSVALNKDSTSIVQGEEETLTATIQPPNATNQKVTWTSDNDTYAIVDQTGKVTAVAEGTANITVMTEDGEKTDTCVVMVTTAVAKTSAKK